MSLGFVIDQKKVGDSSAKCDDAVIKPYDALQNLIKVINK